MKRLAVLCLAALVVAGPAAAGAHAATPSTTACRNKIINEWEGTGRIRTTYPVACYAAALAYVKKRPDLGTYSSIAQDIRAALLARKARAVGKSAPAFVGKPVKRPSTTTSSSGVGPGRGGGSGGGKGPGGTGGSGDGTTLGAQNDSGGSSGTPLPVLILGGVAIVLVAAGAIGTGIRHARRRGA